jgi:streptomycin 6-kinase
MRGIANQRLADRAAAWQDRLGTRLAFVASRWSLTVEGPLAAGETAARVFAVRRADGGEAVLKLAPPGQALEAEAIALAGFAGRGAAGLFATDLAARALLLERLRPGTSLRALAERDDDAATLAAGALMNALRRAPPAGVVLAEASGWVRALERAATDAPGPLPHPMLARTAALMRALAATAPPSVLLHGDLHHDNILRDGPSGWRAVDPKGLRGDPAFEAAAFLRNPPCLTRTPHRIALLAAATGLPRERIAGWGYAGAALAAAWAVEDGTDPTRWCAAAEAIAPALA